MGFGFLTKKALESLMSSDAGPGFAHSRRILVVAPHPDDESLGCGGLISLAANRGSAFFIVFVTDGAASHPTSRAWPRDRLTAQREQEACRALASLGIGDAPRLFLRLEDANMPAPESPAWRDAVANVRGAAALRAGPYDPTLAA
jgi:LmbE family N-acetylglucosaminyl deacetylase